MKIRLLITIAAALLVFLCAGVCFAAKEGAGSAKGRDITDAASLSPHADAWVDGKEGTRASLSASEVLTVTAAEPIGGLYLRYHLLPTGTLTLSGGGREVTLAPDYLHKYLDITGLLGEDVREVTLSCSEKTEIADLFVLSAGEVPDFVQTWEKPCERADLLLAPTHSDDDQLFFLGILPYYAGELGYEVQVVYFTNHNANLARPHELLNGLWTVGVRHYPVIAPMRDAWDGETTTLEYGYANFERQGFEKKDLVDFWVEIIRRFRPQVIVGHDVKGEYGHPQHMVNTDALIEALKVCGDGDYALDGVAHEPYLPDKVYLHLWGENKIVMDWDQPLSAFGGKTAYEVSKLGYACHHSQQWTWFTDWIKGSAGQYTKSTEIRTYSPNKYGLYFTQVGPDTVGGDFFENLTPASRIPPDTEPPMTAPVTTAPPETTAPETTAPKTTEPPPLPPTTDGTRATEQPTSPPTEPQSPELLPPGKGKSAAIAAFAFLALAGGVILAVFILHKPGR